MTFKTLFGVYSHYALKANYTGLIIASTGTVTPGGVASAFYATIENYGHIQSAQQTAGVFLSAGGRVINQLKGTISAGSALDSGHAVWSFGVGSVVNYGSISGSYGVALVAGGSVVNGSPTDTTASINGWTWSVYLGQPATLSNFAALQGGVSLHQGGIVTNGSTADNTASIRGYSGVTANGIVQLTNFGQVEATGALSAGVNLAGGGTVVNFATVRSDGYVGAALGAAGIITNGGLYDTSALITGGDGAVRMTGGADALVNFATITAAYTSAPAVYAGFAGDTVTNGPNSSLGALISGGSGVDMGATGTVINFGTIQGLRKAGVGLYSGGTVANGSTTDTRARIDGYDTGVRVSGASGSVTNFGTIAAHNPGPTKSIGVYFDHGGGLTNGSTTDRAASISGAIGVYAQTLSSVNGATTIVNFATIVGQYGAAVDLTAGGNVTNGAVTDTVAAIDGRIGILFLASQATVTNFGTVQGDGLGGNSGVYFGYGGQMANGTAKDTNALVTGYSGVVSNGIASIVNFGIIDGVGAAATAGVLLNSGGALTNGSLLDAQARIEGYAGVRVSAAGAAIANFGTIQGDGYAGNAGVYLSGGGTVTNGAVTDSIARIDGYSGISAAVTRATIINLGIIQGVGLTSQAGVVLGAGGKIVNGSAKSNKAVIEGYNGLLVSGVATVTNFGTIIGDGGTALQFKSTKDRLIVEAGSTTIGAVKGGGGTMELAAGTGTITGLGGSMSGFAAYIIDTGGSWSLTGTNTLSGTEALTINGTLVNLGGLSLGATVTNAGVLEASTGVLTVNGPLSGAGLCEVAGGRLAFTSTFNGGVTFTTGSTGTLELAHGQTFSGTLTGFSMTGSTFLDLDDINFTAGSTKAVYSGNTAGGVLTVTDGAHTAAIHFIGDYTGSAWVVSSDGHGGVIIHDPPGTPNAALAAGGAKSPSTGLPTLALIHAMAAAPTGADVSIASRQPREETPLLFLAHGTHIA